LLPRPQPPPAPIAIASTSASVSPSPFAPRAQITKSTSPSPSHLAAKETPDVEPVHADRLAVPGELETHGGNEYVMAHEEEEKRPSDSPRDARQAPIGGIQSSLTVDPPLDQDRPSHQVRLSPSRPPLFIPVCTHTRRVIETRTTLGRHQSFGIVAILPRSPRALIKNTFIPSLTHRKSIVFSPSIRSSPSRQR
jgi:hypothetical protein